MNIHLFRKSSKCCAKIRRLILEIQHAKFCTNIPQTWKSLDLFLFRRQHVHLIGSRGEDVGLESWPLEPRWSIWNVTQVGWFLLGFCRLTCGRFLGKWWMLVHAKGDDDDDDGWWILFLWLWNAFILPEALPIWKETWRFIATSAMIMMEDGVWDGWDGYIGEAVAKTHFQFKVRMGGETKKQKGNPQKTSSTAERSLR